MSVTRHELRSFAVADLGTMKVAVDAADVAGVDDVEEGCPPPDFTGALGVDAPAGSVRRLLRLRRGDEVVTLGASSVSLHEARLDRLHRPPAIIARSTRSQGLVAMLELDGGEWAWVLSVARMARDAPEEAGA